MITVSDLNCIEDRYAWWLDIMPDEMPRLSILPKDIRDRLDYSLDSLDVIEKYIADNYSLEEIRDRRNRFAYDIFVRYIGETFRRNFPQLYWFYESEDEHSEYYGIPVLNTVFESSAPLTPTLWVIALIERRVGNFLRSQVESSKAA